MPFFGALQTIENESGDLRKKGSKSASDRESVFSVRALRQTTGLKVA